MPQSIGVSAGLSCALGGSCEETLHALDLSNTRPQYLALDPNDGLVAVDVLLRHEPDDEEDDEEEEDRSNDEDEDDDYGNDDGYSERPSARVIDSIAAGPRPLCWEAQNYLFPSAAT